MNFAEPFIKRPVMTTLVMCSIVFFGILAYFKLPVSNLPDVDYPSIMVEVSYPGANPETMANNVASPLERQFTTIDGVVSMSSTSSTGSTTIALQFTLDKPLNEAAQDVQAAINQAQPNLPPDLPFNPVYRKVNPAQTPVLYYAMSSDTMTKGDLYDYAFSFLGQRLGMVEGVSQVKVYGSPSAVRVQVSPDRIAGALIGINQVADTLISGNTKLPVGTLFGPKDEYTLNVNGQIKKAEGYNNLIIRNNKGALVRVGDMGRALDSLQSDKYSLTYMNRDITQPAVVLAIQKEPGANTLKVIEGIKKLLPDLKKELPKSVHMNTMFDQAEWITEAVEDVEFTLLVAFVLVVLVIFFYLGKLIDTIIPVVALPMSIIGTFAIMEILGFSLDILSLLAITLSVGFLVDDAIVVLENINRHLEMGKSRMSAAIEGSKEIIFTVISMTVCLAAVFIPLLFLEGILGRIFREFACVIVIALLFSGIISLTLTPLLCSRFMELHSKKESDKNFITRFSEKFDATMSSLYKKALDWTMPHKKTLLFIGLGSLVLSGILGSMLPTDFLPDDDLGFIQGYSQSKDGTSPFQMEKYQKQIADLVKNDPNVESLVSIAALPDDNQGLMFIQLKPIKDRKSMRQVMLELRMKMYQIPGVQSFLRAVPLINLDIGTGQSKGAYQYTMQSLKASNLYEQADKMKISLSQEEGFSQVSSDLHNAQRQVFVDINRDKASDLNIDAHTIEQAFTFAFSGGRISTINTPTNQYDVIIETTPDGYKDPSVLNKIYLSTEITTVRGSTTVLQVPLASVASWREGVGPLSINHLNTLPAVTLSFDLNHIPLGTAIDKINKLSEETLSPDIISSVQGTADVFKSTFRNLSFLFLITIFTIYVVLGILYENFIHPITVMSALPPATLGALLTLLLFGMPLSLYAFVGIIMLIGIVLKNGIMMVDFANESIAQGMSIEEAIHHSCLVRLRPILMTTISTAMGALPIALGIGGLTAATRRPLGLVIVGGLMFSQVLTLFFTPVMFIYMETLREKWQRKKQTKRPLEN